MEKSTHKCEVVTIKLEPHGNADTLSIVKVFDYTCVVRTQDWKDGDLAAYVVPDSLVPNKEPFKFLFKPTDTEDSTYRVRVQKYRGIISMGLLVPTPKGSKLGADVASKLGVTRYDPPVKGEAITPCNTKFKTLRKYTFLTVKLMDKLHIPTQWVYQALYRIGWQRTIFSKAPDVYAPEYDVDSMYRYSHVFNAGESVLVTEKIHGCNVRYVVRKGKLYCGSHHMWKPETASDVWWSTIKKYPEIIEWLKANEGIVLYGEIYGDTQRADGFGYGVPVNQNRFAAFNLLKGTKWVDPLEARDMSKGIIPWVPILDTIPFDLEKLKELAEGPSVLAGANHIREGIVVLPLVERTDNRIGRVCLKLVSNGYLLKKGKK